MKYWFYFCLIVCFPNLLFASNFSSECNSSQMISLSVEDGDFRKLEKSNQQNSILDIIANKNTISPFLPWNHNKLSDGNNYYLHWGITQTRDFRDDRLDLWYGNWHYFSGFGWQQWSNPEQQKQYLTQTKYAHPSEFRDAVAVDIINPTYSSDFAFEVQSKGSKPFHGVFLDTFHTNHPVPWAGTKKFENAIVRVASSIRDIMGDKYLIVGNTNWYKNQKLTKLLNGTFLELYKKPISRQDAYTCSEISEMEAVMQFNEKYLLEPKLVAFNPWRVTDQKQYGEDRNTEENQKFARLFSAMSAVVVDNGYILYGDNLNDSTANDHDHYYYSVYNIDLGKPISKSLELKKGVQIKQFEKGYIAYNRRKADTKIKFQNFTVEIPSMDAVFLFNDGTSVFSDLKKTCKTSKSAVSTKEDSSLFEFTKCVVDKKVIFEGVQPGTTLYTDLSDLAIKNPKYIIGYFGKNDEPKEVLVAVGETHMWVRGKVKIEGEWCDISHKRVEPKSMKINCPSGFVFNGDFVANE